MKINAEEMTVGDLFNRRNLVFQVPIYQRPYDWGTDNWSDLWNDVINNDSEGTHFIGSLVAINQAARVKGFDKFEIVDGQQRLTTLSILFCALKDHYKEKGEDSQSQKIQESCLESSTVREESRKLFLGRTDDDNYNALLQSRPIEKSNVTRAYSYFKEKIKTIEDPDDILDRFTTGVSLVWITAENAEDAFKLFETLNDRGLELSAVDLIKNYILSSTATKNIEDLDTVIEFWDSIITHLEEIDKIDASVKSSLRRRG